MKKRVQWKALALMAMLQWGTPGSAVAEDVFQQVKPDMAAGRYEQVVDRLQAHISQAADDYQAWFILGVAQAHMQKYHQAIEAFRRVIELQPTLAEPHNNLAVIYNELSDYRMAVVELEQSLAKRPGYAVAEENLGDMYVKLALKNYRSALEKNKNEALAQRYNKLLKVRDPNSQMSDEDVAVDVASSAAKPRVAEQVPATAVPVAVQPETDAPQVASAAEPAVSDAAAVVQKVPEEVVQSVEEASKSSVDLEADVLAAVENWRLAWSEKNLDAYFAAYSDDFRVPAANKTLKGWRSYKKRVIGNKAFIQVTMENLDIQLSKDGNEAKVTFLQHFHSDSYNGDDRKVLKLQRENQTWKIVEEKSVS